MIKQWTSIYGQRSLILLMAKREFKSRYKGAILGFFWSILQPILLMVLYTVVFTLIFKSKWDIEGIHPSLIIFSGITCYLLLSEVISQSTTVIHTNNTFIKKVLFPVEILPVVTVLTSFIQFSISTFILVVVLFVTTPNIGITLIFLPFVVLPLFIMLCGISWLFSAIGVFIKDIREIAGLISTILLFTGGIIFPLHRVTMDYQYIFNWNPLTIIVKQLRTILLEGHAPDFTILLYYLIISFIFASCMLYLFNKGRRLFSDVL